MAGSSCRMAEMESDGIRNPESFGLTSVDVGEAVLPRQFPDREEAAGFLEDGGIGCECRHGSAQILRRLGWLP
jgi:hypothetical protein